MARKATKEDIGKEVTGDFLVGRFVIKAIGEFSFLVENADTGTCCAIRNDCQDYTIIDPPAPRKMIRERLGISGLVMSADEFTGSERKLFEYFSGEIARIVNILDADLAELRKEKGA